MIRQFAVTALVALGFVAAAAQADIVRGAGDHCIMSVAGRGSLVVARRCERNTRQFWNRQGLTLRQGNLCLSIRLPGIAPGSEMNLTECDGGPHQDFRFDKNRMVGFKGLCVEMAEEPSNPLTVQNCQPLERRQIWRLDGEP